MDISAQYTTDIEDIQRVVKIAAKIFPKSGYLPFYVTYFFL